MALFVIDELVSNKAQLVIIPRKPHKRPKVWAVHHLRMRSVAFDRPMPFTAALTNAVPPGEIDTTVSFGPWMTKNPGSTPLGGTFTFERAVLGVYEGIAGILSARGRFGGTLDRVDVHGKTDTPAFTITSAGHPVPLQTTYHAIVDGTNGDTILERVDASFLETSLVARGGVIDAPGHEGRSVTLDVTMDRARLEDLLRLAVKSTPSPMTGALTLTTNLVLPPGHQNVTRGHAQ